MRLGTGYVVLCATLGFTSTAMGQKQTDLPFRLIDGWAVVVKGTIGGEPSRTILIDTGAVPSAISKEMAKKLGLLGTAEQVSVMNRAIDVERVRVPKVQVGPVAADAFEMVAADLGAIEQALHTRLDAVIGLDLLGRENFAIDFKSKKLVFGMAVQAADSITFELKHAAGGTYVLVPMESGGEKFQMSYLETAVDIGQFLLDNVGFYRHAEVVGLGTEVRRRVEVLLGGFERRVPEIAPEHGHHAELVSHLERLAHLDDLPARLVGPVVDRAPDGRAPHVAGLLDRGEHDLVELVRVGQELVVVDLEEERDLVRVLPRDGPEDAERRGDGVAPPFDGGLHDPLRVEADGVLREARAGRVLDPLVDRQDREVPGPTETPVVDELLEAPQDGDGAVGHRPDPVDDVGPREVERFLRDPRARVDDRRPCDPSRQPRSGRGHDRLGPGHGDQAERPDR